MVKNDEEKQMFEFIPPSTKIAGITVCPGVGKLGPGEACRVEVTYKPELIKIAVDGTDTSKPPEKKVAVEDLRTIPQAKSPVAGQVQRAVSQNQRGKRKAENRLGRDQGRARRRKRIRRKA